VSLAVSSFDARGLAVVVALTAFAIVEREFEATPEPTHRFVAAEPTQKLVAVEHQPPDVEKCGDCGAHPTYPLPAEVQAPEDWRPSLVVQVRIDGSVRVVGKLFDDRELDNLFRAAFAHDMGTQIVLKAQKGVAHRRIVDLMERAKATGLKRIAIGISAE
jgi:hypothetical protein